jgi:GGDEF domain-containing protein
MERETGRKLSLPLAFRQERRDELTGLSTMTAFMEQAGKEIQTGGAAFLYFNMENFRLVNQRYGFQAGNQLLIHIAQVLSDIFGAVPMARLNDDRFVVMTRAPHVALEVERAQTSIHEAEPRLSLVVKVASMSRSRASRISRSSSTARSLPATASRACTTAISPGSIPRWRRR